MGPLAQTLALLAMTTATAVMDEVPMDMAPNSFDDQYWGCRDKMTAVLPALHWSELQQNSLFAQAWAQARAEWQKRGSPVPRLLFSDQAIAIMAYTGPTSLNKEFNNALRAAGRSGQQYRDNFHFKALHFLLTTALATLRVTQGAHCRDVFWDMRNIRFEARPGQTVRFGQFTSTLPREMVPKGYEMDTFFLVTTCYGVVMANLSFNPSEQKVLIPPFETFEVTELTFPGDKTQTWLFSVGTHSKYNCEWLGGGSSPRDTPMLGQLLLATAALAVATGIF